MSTTTDRLQSPDSRLQEGPAITNSEAWGLKPGAYDVPFRHVIIDNWAEPELVRAADTEWPDTNWPFWHRYECGKLATKDPLRFPPACAELIRRMLSLGLVTRTSNVVACVTRQSPCSFRCQDARLSGPGSGSFSINRRGPMTRCNSC